MACLSVRTCDPPPVRAGSPGSFLGGAWQRVPGAVMSAGDARLKPATLVGTWPQDAAACRHAGAVREIAGCGPPRPGARNQDRREVAGWPLAGKWHGGAGQAAPAVLVA
jgi:hypothetical protein